MNVFFFRTACVSIALAVILGAMGAHALKDKLDSYQMDVYETGAQYHFLNALGLLVLAVIASNLKNGAIWPMRLLLIGMVLFSGSLYSLATLHLCDMQQLKSIIGPVTPVGGVCFIVAWLWAALSVKKN